jgi:hypothetical protein
VHGNALHAPRATQATPGAHQAAQGQGGHAAELGPHSRAGGRAGAQPCPGGAVRGRRGQGGRAMGPGSRATGAREAMPPGPGEVAPPGAAPRGAKAGGAPRAREVVPPGRARGGGSSDTRREGKGREGERERGEGGSPWDPKFGGNHHRST